MKIQRLWVDAHHPECVCCDASTPLDLVSVLTVIRTYYCTCCSVTIRAAEDGRVLTVTGPK